MLIDRLRQTEHFSRQTFELVMAARYSARRFVFTDETTEAIANLFREEPQLFLGNYQFAIPPYDETYIEFNHQVWCRASQTAIDDPKADLTCAHLTKNGNIYGIVSGKADLDIPIIMPLCYSLDMPPETVPHRPARDYRKFPFSETHKMAIILGGRLMEAATDEICADLDTRCNIYVSELLIDRLQRDHGDGLFGGLSRKLHAYMLKHAGELRCYMAHMLWLNRIKTSQQLVLDTRPRERRLVKGRPVVFQEHHIVRLKPEVSYRHLARSLLKRESPRRHEVEGFFRNFNKTECEHDWPLLPDENNRWYCRKCPQWRIRVKDHLRGDASKGFITKEYKA